MKEQKEFSIYQVMGEFINCIYKYCKHSFFKEYFMLVYLII